MVSWEERKIHADLDYGTVCPINGVERAVPTVMHSAMLCVRLVEDADFRAAQELFGGQDLDKMQLKSAKDFEDFAATLVHKYVEAHSRSPPL